MTKKQKTALSYVFGGVILLLITAQFFYNAGHNRAGVEKTKQGLGIISNQDTNKDIGNNKDDTGSSRKNQAIAPESGIIYATGGEDIPLSKDFFASLPVEPSFGNPVDLGAGKFTYSDLKGLEISRGPLSSYSGTINCDTVTDVLSSTLSGYYWWNICRPIGKINPAENNKNISFFVLRLNDEGTEYIYEKHYILVSKGWYGTYELQTGIPADKTHIDADMRTQSDLLKSARFDASPISIVDDLFMKLSVENKN